MTALTFRLSTIDASLGLPNETPAMENPSTAEIRPAGTRRFPEHATPLHQYHNPDSLTID